MFFLLSIEKVEKKKKSTTKKTSRFTQMSSNNIQQELDLNTIIANNHQQSQNYLVVGGYATHLESVDDSSKSNVTSLINFAATLIVLISTATAFTRFRSAT